MILQQLLVLVRSNFGGLVLGCIEAEFASKCLLPAEPAFLSRDANNNNNNNTNSTNTNNNNHTNSNTTNNNNTNNKHHQQVGARGVIFVGSAGVVHVMFFRAFIKEFIKEFSLPAEAVGVGCHFRPAVWGPARVWVLFRISVSTHQFH